MKNFKQLIKELPCSKIVVAYGDFQPPTSVHEHLVKAVKTVAGSSADYTIYASANEDKKYNPLPVDRKVYFLNRMFPGTNFQETTEQTIVGLAKKLNEKYKVLTVVVGEDKVADVTKQLTKANGKEFTFESIKVVSTGSTDPDSDLSSGVSGLRMCESAKSGKFNEFKKGLPHTLTEHDSRRLMNEVRKGLGQEPIKEVVEFQRSSIREQYIAGEIFNVGDKVQDDKGVYEVMDRGANYITVVNESGVLSKKWIDKVTVVEDVINKKSKYNLAKSILRPDDFKKLKKVQEDIPGGYAPEEISFKGYTTKNLHHSSDAAKAFQQTIAKYQGGLIKDGVAVLNALKHTDEYMQIGDTHLEQMKPPIQSEVTQWIHAHMKAKESLERIGEFLHHMDYWDSHGHELQMLMTNYKEAGKGEVSESHNTEGTMANDKLRNDPETKRVMLRYKDFIKTATMTEPPVEMGQDSASDYKKPEEPKVASVKKVDGKQTESDIDSEVKKTEPKHVATGFAMQKPFDVNDTLRRQKVKYQLGEGIDNYASIAKELVKRHGNNVTKQHIKDIENERDSRSSLDHDEVMAHVKKLSEDVYASDYVVHQHVDPVTGKTKSHKIRPNRINFAASGAQGGLVKDKKPKMSALDKWRAGADIRAKQQQADAEYYQKQKNKPYSPEADKERSKSMSASIDKLAKRLKEETINETADAGLAAKAEKSGISIGTLRKVYRRGVAAWNSGHRPGTTPQQWGMARVNSYITKGKGTYHGADKDLREEEILEGDTSKLPRVDKDKESGLPKKYVAGLSADTAKARAAHWDKMDKKSDSDPSAYEPAPGDATAKTKLSKHTLKYRAMFGEEIDEELLEACWSGYRQIGVKKKGSKMVPNCVPVKEELDELIDILDEAVDTIDKGEYDYEGAMARTQLQTIARSSTELIDMLTPYENMPEWVQSKITLAQDYITCVKDYLKSREELGEGYKPEHNLRPGWMVKADPELKKKIDAAKARRAEFKRLVGKDVKKPTYEAWVLTQTSMIGKEKAEPKQEQPEEVETDPETKQSGWPYLGESKLNPANVHKDYQEKNKVLQQLSMNKNVDQKAVQQRKLDLDKEYSKVKNEEVEQIDELDKSTVKSYLKKKISKPGVPTQKDVDGIGRATVRLMNKEEVESELEEAKKKVLKPKADTATLTVGGTPPFDPFFEEHEIDEMVNEYADLEDMLEEYDDSELILVDEETGEEFEVEQDDEPIMEVLSRVERLKSKVRFARGSTKRGRLLQIRLKTKSTPERINQRAKRLAMRTLKQKIVKKPLGQMSISDKERAERVLHNPQFQSVINRLAMKMANRVRETEAKRMHKLAKKASPNAKHNIKKR